MRWIEPLLAALPTVPADAVSRIVTFMRQREALAVNIKEKQPTFNAAVAPALHLLARAGTAEALQAFAAFLSGESALIRTAALNALPADMSDEWWDVLAPMAMQRRRYAFVAARPAGRRALLDLFQRTPAARRDVLDVLRPYLESDPAVFDGIAAAELTARFAYRDPAAFCAAPEIARRVGAEQLAAAFDDAVAAAQAEEAFAPEYNRVLSSDAYGSDDMKSVGAKHEALRSTTRAALARAAERWERLLASDAERCRQFLQQ